MKNQENQALKELNRFIKGFSSQRSAAEKLGITPQYLHDILNQRRGISTHVAAKLGLKKITVYERI